MRTLGEFFARLEAEAVKRGLMEPGAAPPCEWPEPETNTPPVPENAEQSWLPYRDSE